MRDYTRRMNKSAQPRPPSYTQVHGIVTPPEKGGETRGLDNLFLKLLVGSQRTWLASPQRQAEKPIFEMVDKLCRRMGIDKKPEILLYQGKLPDAASLVTGRVAVEIKLLDILTPAQLEAVLGHELAHHRHKARDLSYMAGGDISLAAAYEFAGRKQVGKLIARQPVGSFKRIGLIAAEQLAGFFAAVGVLNLYQQSIEYESDRESAKYTGKPNEMIGALKALDEYFNEAAAKERRHRRAHMSDAGKVAEDTIEKIEPRWVRRIRHNPFEVLGTHPPTYKRIEALKGYAAHEEAAAQASSSRGA